MENGKKKKKENPHNKTGLTISFIHSRILMDFMEIRPDIAGNESK